MAIALVAIFAWRRTPFVPILRITIASNLFYVYAINLLAGRFQDFQQHINHSTSSLRLETVGECKKKTLQLMSEKIVTELRNDAGESQTKPSDFTVNKLENGDRGQMKLFQVLVSTHIDA